MKKTITILSLAITTLIANATVITVNNNSNSPGQYTDLQTAIDAANAGDTIYVSGSTTSYGTISINKTLALFGTGANPQKQIPVVSSIGTVNFDTLMNVSNASGTVISGFDILGEVGVYFTHPTQPTNIQIKRNDLSNGSINVESNNWLVENNIVFRVNIGNNNNVIVNNNIVIYDITGSDQPNVVITNNLFIAPSNPNGTCLSGISNATISNNIFYGTSPGPGNGGCTNSTFNKNLTFTTSQDTIPYGSNVGSGNIINQDPKFTSLQTINFTFTPTDDYRLLTTSPGYNIGTDGTDIGPFGGGSPFPSSPIGGEPNIPQVKTMNITNTVIPVNGTINLSVKGKKQN